MVIIVIIVIIVKILIVIIIISISTQKPGSWLVLVEIEAGEPQLEAKLDFSSLAGPGSGKRE